MSTRIEASADGLLVQISADRSLTNLLLSMVGVLFLVVKGVRARTQVEANLHASANVWLSHVLIFCLPVLGVLLFLWVVMQLLRPYFGSEQTLRVTRTELEVTSTDYGRIWQKKTFAKEEVCSIAFGVVETTRHGNIKGLKFEVRRGEVKALYDLKAVEAQQVLAELRRLGFDVVIDPAMKMLIEMEQSQNRSFFK